MLPVAVASQGFKAIGRRNPQISEALRSIQQAQLAQGDKLYVAGQTTALRRPSQIVAASLPRKLPIMQLYDA